MMFRITCYLEKAFNENAAFIAYIYSELFKQEGLIYYDYITIELSNNEAEEYRILGINTKKLFVFKKFDVQSYYRLVNEDEKKKFLLNLFSEVTREIAKRDDRIPIQQLELINKTVLEKDFLFDFVYHRIPHKKIDVTVSFVVKPLLNLFEFSLQVFEGVKQKCSILIYKGKPSDYYIDDLFATGKWKGHSEFVLKGRRSEVEFHLDINSCKVVLVNTAPNKNQAPIFNMFRSDAGEKELQDYISSLNPAIASMITQSQN